MIPWLRLLPAAVAVAAVAGFAALSFRLDRVRVELAEVRQVNDGLRDDLHAARTEAAAAHARGYADGYRTATDVQATQIRGLQESVGIIAAGCVYLPDAERLKVQPLRVTRR